MKHLAEQLNREDMEAVFALLPGNTVLLLPDAPLFTIVAVSENFLKAAGRKPEDLIGKSFLEVFPDNPHQKSQNSSPPARASLEQALKLKAPHTAPVTRYGVTNSKGIPEARYWSTTHKPVLNKQGEVIYLLQSTTEVTEKVKAAERETQIKNIEKAFDLFMHTPMVIAKLKGEDHVIEMVNDEALKLWGKGNGVIGKPLLQVVPEIKGQGITELLNRVRTTGQPHFAKEERVVSSANGKETTYYFNRVYQPYYDGESSPATGVFVLSHDVTELVTARKKVEESEEKYRKLFATMDQGFCILEMIFDAGHSPVDYRFLETNPVFEQQTGLKDATGKTARELVPNLEQHWFDLYGRVATTGEPLRFVEGSEAMGRSFEVYAFRMGGEGSRKVALLFTNISERRKAEEALRQSENNLRNMIMQAPAAMAILTGPTHVVEIANDRMFELWGRSREELLNKSVFEGLPEARNQGYEDLLSRVYATGETFSAYGIPVALPRRGGIETIYINLLYEAFREGDGTISGIMAVATDVTEQALARKKIEENEIRLQLMVEERTQELQSQKTLLDNILTNSSNGISVTEMIRDEKGNIIDARTILANNAAVNLTGLPRNLYLSATATQLDPNILHTPYGQTCLRTLETGISAIVQYRLNATGRWLELTISKMDDDHLIHIFTDVTPIKEAQLQLEKSVEELRRSNQNLEEFAYAASHDMKEPIRKVHYFSDRLKSELAETLTESQRRLFDRMQHATDRMSTLIDDLLTYSHLTKGVSNLEEIDLNVKLQLVLEDLELEIEEKRASITVQALPTIKGNKRQFQQLFLNLIGNALKYARAGLAPDIQISASVVMGKDAPYSLPAEDSEKLFHLVTVQDNGIGFSQEDAVRIFNVFTRLHGNAEYRGSGVGLSIVRKVVENHNGYVWAQSQLGNGATFFMLLPVD